MLRRRVRRILGREEAEVGERVYAPVYDITITRDTRWKIRMGLRLEVDEEEVVQIYQAGLTLGEDTVLCTDDGRICVVPPLDEAFKVTISGEPHYRIARIEMY